jgi:hypothetical protein
MLSIYFGEKEEVMHGPSWFRFNYDEQWLADPFVAEMMADIDKSYYKGGQLIESDVLGPIPPERLSGGLQTLICIYKRPDLIFNATSCGENCAKWLAEIGRRENVTVNLRYYMPFDDCGDIEFEILNENVKVTNLREYMHVALKYV